MRTKRLRHTFSQCKFLMQMDIERASGNIILHSIFVPLMEPGGRVEGEYKCLNEFSSLWKKRKACM